MSGLLGYLLMFGGELLPEVRDLSPISLFVIPYISAPEVGSWMVWGNLDRVVLGSVRLPYWFLGL